MKDNPNDTPPSSINGDELGIMEDDGAMYLDEMEEVELDRLQEILQEEEEYYSREPPYDNATVVFNKHKGSIFCCHLHPEGKLAVTGGEDDVAYVWSTETGQVLMQTEGHKDSVIFTAFSSDGAYLATGDMSGLIKVWKCNTESLNVPWELVFEYETEDLSIGLWHFGARVLCIGTATGDIYIFKIPSGETKVLQGYTNNVECAQIFPDGKRLAAGYRDGGIRIWDLKTCQVLHQVPASVHNERVTSLDVHPGNNLIASISSDGKLVLTATNTGKVVNQQEVERELEVVAFAKNTEIDFFALGTLNGSLSIWDSGRQMMRHQCSKSSDEEAAGVTKMLWINDQLVTAGLDGSVTQYDGRSGEKRLTLTGHTAELLDMTYNAKENIILTASDDTTARIFKL